MPQASQREDYARAHGALRFDFVDCAEQDKSQIRAIHGPRITRKNKSVYQVNLLRQKWFKCENCGHLFRNPQRGVGYGHTRQYCSRPCAIAKQKKDRVEAKLADRPYSRLIWMKCAVCGTRTISRQPNKVTCSRGCAKEHAKRYSRELAESRHEEKQFACQECGKEVVVRYGVKNRYFCSHRCCTKHVARQRRHRLRSNGKVERITLAALRQRDANVCHLCGKKVGGHTHWPGGASIDHLIPVSQGGTHTWKNVALAHVRCNTLRRDKGEAQLRLLE